MTAVLSMTDKLKVPTMLAEDKEISAAFSQLKNVASSENDSEGVKFADELTHMCRTRNKSPIRWRW
jgi:hypothetical protein